MSKIIPVILNKPIGVMTPICRVGTGCSAAVYRCRCECGAEKNIAGYVLRKNKYIRCPHKNVNRTGPKEKKKINHDKMIDSYLRGLELT
jgi:hypothetical protein